MAELVSGTYRLDDDEAIQFLNAGAGTLFDPAHFEIESVELVVGESGEKSLVVVVGEKG